MQVRPLSEPLRKKAEAEINEDSKTIEINLKILRNWLNTHSYLHNIDATDQWLIAFLRGSKYIQDKARSKLEQYYCLRDTAPEFFVNRDPFDPANQELLKLGTYLPLRKLMHPDSPRLCLIRIGQIAGTRFKVADVIKISFMITEILLLEDDNFVVAGEDVISDLNGCGFNVMRQWTPMFARKTFICTEKALTIRMKNLHILNAGRGIMTAVMITKMFLAAKLKERIHVYNNDYEGMYDFVNRSVLPLEYGGHDGNLQDLTDYWKAKVESYRDWFLRQEELCGREPLKRANTQTNKPNEDFRSLNVN